MHRSLKSLLTWTALAFYSVTAQGALSDLLDVIPADSRLVLTTPNLGQLIRDLEQSPYNQAATRSDVHHAVGEGARAFNGIYWDRWLKKNSGYSLKDFAAASDGALLFMSPDARSLQGEAPSFALVVELGDARVALLEMLKQRQATRAAAVAGHELREFEEEHFDETLHLREYVAGGDAIPGEGWAMFDDKLVLARPAAYLRATVASLKSGSAEAPWSKRDDIGERLSEFTANDLSLWIVADDIVPLTAAYLRSRSGEGDDEGHVDDPELSAEENEMMRRARESRWTSYSEYFLQEIVPELYRVGLRSLQIGLDLGGDASQIVIDYQYGEGEGMASRGVLSLLPGPVKLPDFIYRDVIAASVARLDIPDIWRKVEEFAGDQQAAMAGGMMGGMVLGGDNDKLSEYILAGVGDLLIELKMPAAGVALDAKEERPEPDSLVLLSIKDRAAMESALALLREEAGWSEMMETREFMNTTIYSLKKEIIGDIPGVKLPAFAVSDRYLVYADQDKAVTTLLTRIADPSRDLAYQRDEDLQRILENLAGDYSVLAVDQPASFLQGIFAKLRNLPSPSVEGEKASCGGRPKLEREWFNGLLHAVVATGYALDDGARLRSHYYLSHGDNDE